MIDKNFWRGKKVLVTGHTGFKGGWLSIWLNFLEARIVGYSLDPITKKNFFGETNIKKIFIKDYRKNIQNIKDLTECIHTFKPEIIFHLAAQPQVLESYNQPLETIKTNVIGTANLLEIVRKLKYVKAVVIITTDKVYKNLNKDIKFKEDATLGGDDIYSSSKASADILTASYEKSFFKNSTNLASVRAGNCIGGGDWTKFRILTDSVNAFSKNKKLKLRNPSYKRPWQHVLEPLAGYLLLAKKLYSKNGSKYNGSWNFGPTTKKHLSVFEFAKLLKKKMNSVSKIILLKHEDNKEKYTLDLNSAKAKNFLNWKPLLNIEKTLSLTADWYVASKSKKNMYKFSLEQIKIYSNLINKK
jgi:CDP-glucose 4,6-dehydratase